VAVSRARCVTEPACVLADSHRQPRRENAAVFELILTPCGKHGTGS